MLKELQIRQLKPKEKAYKIYDSNGLFLSVSSSGRKTWKISINYQKKRTTKTIGTYPEISLKEARTIRDKLKEELKEKGFYYFKKVSLDFLFNEYIKLRQKDIKERTIKKIIERYNKHIKPYIGSKNVNELSSKEIIYIIKQIEDSSIETAHRMFSLLNRIFRFSVTLGYINHNPLSDIDKSIILKKIQYTNLKHTTNIDELASFLKAVDNYVGYITIKRALQVLPYLFVRPANIRFMQWKEIDFEKKLWIIPADKMKNGKEHIVPLYEFVIKILKQQQKNSINDDEYVFYSPRGKSRAISNNTLNVAIKTLGFDLTSHGFRHTASTILHENIYIHKINSEVIEMQLSHSIGNSVHRTYNKAKYLPERIKLMNWWGKYLDNLKNKK